MKTAMRCRSTGFVVLAWGLIVAHSAGAVDITGTWQAEFDTQIGLQKYVFTFTLDGDAIAGKADAGVGGQKRAVELRDVRLADNVITFVETFAFQDNEIRIEYTGRVANDEIQFTRQVGDFVTEQFVAKRGAATTAPAEGNDPPARPPRRAGRGPLRFPKPGPCPLPILPALPAYDDTSFYAVQDVPHGTVEEAMYWTQAGQDKRMHIYLPPGYKTDTETRYPVLYLNHGGGDDDAKWTSTHPRDGGHAQFILDNLIAAGKAKAMIVVMPNTRGLASAEPPVLGHDDPCTHEFLQTIIPYVEKHYRAGTGRENRALAGLSMGGFVVMNTGLSRLDTFSELYVYSSGYFDEQRQGFEDNLRDLLADPNTNDLLRVPFYMAAGETDIALGNSQKTLAILNQYALRNFWVLSSGGHEWANWRRYLYQTAQIMFPDDRSQ